MIYKVDDQQLSFLTNGGRMGELMLAKNWHQTLLGAPSDWPETLKNMIRLILENSSPMYLAWGNQCAQFYNDSFSPLLKPEFHLSALGENAQLAFPDFWQKIIVPIFEKVMMGESAKCDDIYFPLYREGKGSEGYFSFSLSPLRDEKGKVSGIIVIANETTQRVFSEKKLKEEQDRLRLIADKVPSFVSYTDIEGNYKFANRTYEEWGKKPLSKIVGFNREDFIKDAKTFDYLKSFVDRSYSGERVAFDLHLVNDVGEALYLEMEYIPDIDLVTNKVKGVVHIGNDVTARRKAEESEERYRSLADTIPQMMWAASPAGKINFVNQRCLEYTGTSSQTTFLDVWMRTIHPLDRPYVSKAWVESMQTGKVFKEEYRIRRFDGEYVGF